MEMLMPAQSDDQPSADEYGVPQTELEDDAPEGGLEPPIGPAVFKPVPTRRPFPAEG
jgi:hypothetical protein